MTTFDTALTEIFEGREEDFSQHLRGLLRQLYERGGTDSAPPTPKAPPKTEPTKSTSEGVLATMDKTSPGEIVASIAHLRAGQKFQNDYLRREGLHREVVKLHTRQKKPDPKVVTHLTTKVVRTVDGVVIRQQERFDQDKFQMYKPYRRLK
jgi:hypothetical protein